MNILLSLIGSHFTAAGLRFVCQYVQYQSTGEKKVKWSLMSGQSLHSKLCSCEYLVSILAFGIDGGAKGKLQSISGCDVFCH